MTIKIFPVFKNLEDLKSTVNKLLLQILIGILKD